MSGSRRIANVVLGSVLPLIAIGLVAASPSQARQERESVLDPTTQQAAVGAGYYYWSMQGVAAVTSNDAWAVGETGWTGAVLHGPSDLTTLIEHWDGAAWTHVASPKVARPGALTAVSAVGGDDVWAVGSSAGKALVEHFDGTHWSVVATPTTSGGTALTSITALGSDDIWAAGHQGGLTLIEHWNGTAWSIVSDADPVCSGHAVLTGVTAISANDAWVVGRCLYKSGRDHLGHPILEHWNGTAWSQVQSPSQNLSFTAVSAASQDDVWAVGRVPSGAAVEHWNGTRWSDVSVPSQGEHEFLDSVDAISATNAWAVGENRYDPTKTVILHWNGAVWQAAPTVGPSARFHLFAIASTSSGDIWSVGAVGVGFSYPMQTLALHYGGSGWTRVSTPSPGGREYGELIALSADSPTDAWAVGDNPYRITPLIDHWDGTRWLRVPSPNPGGAGSDNELSAVAAVSPQDVWALGLTKTGYQQADVLAEHWNGTTWKRVPAPSPGNAYHDDYFTDISAVSRSDVWATGEEYYSGMSFIEHWNGHHWSVSEQSALNGSELLGVASIAADDVWAVGIENAGGGPLALHWDGQSWSEQTQGLPDGFDWLTDVTASGGAVFASGSQFGEDYQWTGSGWTGMQQGSAPTGWQYGIGADSGTDALAVGFTQAFGSGVALAARWDGQQWDQVSCPLPKPLSTGGFFRVAAVGASLAWAVGQGRDRAGLEYPLLEQWNGSTWLPVLPRGEQAPNR